MLKRAKQSRIYTNFPIGLIIYCSHIGLNIYCSVTGLTIDFCKSIFKMCAPKGYKIAARTDYNMPALTGYELAANTGYSYNAVA